MNTDTENSDIPRMLLLAASDCNIKLQSLNAENARAKFLVISKAENGKTNEMFDQSLGSSHIKVNIPTVIVDYEVGKKMRDLMDESGELFLKFTMPLPKHDRVDLDIYAVKTDESIWNFIAGFKNYALQFQAKLNVKVHVFSTTDKFSDAKLELNFSCLEKEQLFEVMPLFISECVKAKQVTPECLDKQVNTFDRSFNQSYSQCKSINKNNMLNIKSEQKDLTIEKTSFLQLNKSIYHGSVRPNNVFEAICGGFVESPGNCLFLNNKYVMNRDFHKILNQKKKHKTMIIIASLFVTMLLVSLAGFLLCVIYNKIYQRTLNEKVADMVRDSVVQYQSMKDNV